MMFNCCCAQCVIATDTFDDDATTGWTTSGTVTEAGGLMDMAGASSAIFDTETGGVRDIAAATTFPLNTDATATMRLIVCYSDASNFLFGEFEKLNDGTGTIRLGQNVGGSESWLTDAVTVDDTDAELDARGTLCLSFEPGETQAAEPFVIGVHASSVDTTGSWTDEANMLGPDDDTGGLGSSEAAGVQATFGFVGLAAPPGSTIDGIEVGIRCKRAAALGSIELRGLQLGIGLLPVGDDRGGSITVPTGSYAVVGDGDATDDWNAGLTWEDLPNLSLFTDWDTSGSGSQLDVDSVFVQVYFTTPSRDPGKLRLSYTNTGSPQNTQCVTDYNAENPAAGRKTGIVVVSGDWDFTEYQLSCAACGCDVVAGEPCPCCAEDFPPAESYTVTVTQPFDDNECSACDLINGTYVLDPNGACGWYYDEQLDCTHATCAPDVPARFAIHAFLGQDCKWRVTLHITASGVGSGSLCGTHIRYEAADPIATDEDCQTGPVTLNRVFQRTDGILCTSDGPSTLELDVA